MKTKIPHLILAGMLGTSITSQAATVVWDGSGGDTDWSAAPDTTSWSGGTYNNGDDAEFNGAGSTVNITGIVTPGSITVADGGTNYSFTDGTGEIQGTGGLTKTGSGRLTLDTGVANYTGDTNINEGILRINNNGGAEWDLGAVFINNSSTLELTSNTLLRANDSITFGSSGGGSIVNLATTAMRNNTITTTGGAKNTISGGGTNGASAGRSVIFDVAVGTDPDGIDLEVSSLMANNGITKDGAGTLALTAASNGMGGDLIVNAGTVLVEGAYTFGVGGVTVASGATLGGSGSITVNDPATYNVTVNGRLSPGNSPGTMTITSDVVWNNGGSYLWEINALDIDGGGTIGTDPGWDWIDITGELDLSNLTAGGFTIDIDSLAGAVAGDALGFDTFLEDGLDPGDHDYSFIIASASDGITGFNANLFTLDDSGFSNFEPDFGWYWDIVQIDNDLVLQAYAVPEPSSTALLGLGGLALALRRRRA